MSGGQSANLFEIQEALVHLKRFQIVTSRSQFRQNG